MEEYSECNKTSEYRLQKMPCHIKDILIDRKADLSKMKRRNVSMEEAAYDIIRQWNEQQLKKAA